jgi:Family of unknown function (DUF5302)
MSDSAKGPAPKAKADQDAPETDVKQGEPEPVTEAAAAQDPGDGAKPDMDEVKRKFREALERKHEIQAEGQDRGSRDPNKIHGAHGPAASRRNFRRKSG